MEKKITCLLFFLLFFTNAFLAQDVLKIGQWKTHLPHLRGTSVTQSADKVFYATQFSVLSIDKQDGSNEYLDKVNRLNDVDIQFLKYDQATQILFIAYKNSNIDLVTPNGTFNINAIKRKTDLLGDKAIYDVFFKGRIAYLACGFGIVQINLQNFSISFTTFSQLKINSITVNQGIIYAASEEGIFTAPEQGTNLQDFDNWQLLGTQSGFPNQYQSKAILTYNNKVYADVNDALFLISNDPPQRIFQENGYSIKFLSAGKQKMLLGLWCGDLCQGKTMLLHDNGSVATAPPRCVDRPLYAVEDEQNRIWYADSYNQIRVQYAPNAANCEYQYYNAPFAETAFDMIVKDEALWVATGGVTSNYHPLFSGTGTAEYANGKWTILNGSTTPFLQDVNDHLTIDIHPNNKKIYIGTFAKGLLEYDGTNFAIFNPSNSALQGAINDVNNCRVTGIQFDDAARLWISNHGAPNPIVVKNADNTWKSFPTPASRELTQIAIDEYNNKWFATSNSNGLLVFNEGSDLNNTQDDRYRLIYESNSALPTNSVNCVTTDLDGAVWVGTKQGTIVFDCANDPFNAPNCTGFRPVVKRDDGNNEYLLAPEDVRVIAIDGANRKWFGTNNGVFVQSPDGLTQIAYFNENNSPLLDNAISSITFNERTGEVFIGTARGINAFKYTATYGGKTHASEVLVFPNPVRPDYEGDIAIRGLPRDANVKITDASGRLVYETTALGGQAIWNGKDYLGRKVATGVYMVFSTSEKYLDKPDAMLAKILFIK